MLLCTNRYKSYVCQSHMRLEPIKNETRRVCMTVGGDKLEHESARFATADIKNHYLQSLMQQHQYMRIPLKYSTQDIRDKYNIMNIVEDNYVYIEIRKGVYGLK